MIKHARNNNTNTHTCTKGHKENQISAEEMDNKTITYLWKK